MFRRKTIRVNPYIVNLPENDRVYRQPRKRIGSTRMWEPHSPGLAQRIRNAFRRKKTEPRYVMHRGKKHLVSPMQYQTMQNRNADWQEYGHLRNAHSYVNIIEPWNDRDGFWRRIGKNGEWHPIGNLRGKAYVKPTNRAAHVREGYRLSGSPALQRLLGGNLPASQLSSGRSSAQSRVSNARSRSPTVMNRIKSMSPLRRTPSIQNRRRSRVSA